MSLITMVLWASVVCFVLLLGVIYRQSCVNAGYALPFAAFLQGVTWQVSNCGGNSAALSQCKMLALTAAAQAREHRGVFDLNSLQEPDLTEVVAYCKNHWVGGAGFLIKTNFVLGKLPREIVALCDTAFDNVPQPTFWNGHRRNPGHAVAYSDGSADLISPTEFTRLDLSAFVNTNQLESSSLP